MSNEELGIYGSGSFNYSGVKPDNLSESSYTLVTIACDISGSVESFKTDLVAMLKSILGSCKKSPKVDNLLIRRINFNDSIKEFHGFVPISLIDDSSYDKFSCGGYTALNDAVFGSIQNTLEYSKVLTDQDFTINGIVFIITDGCDNSSTKSTKDIKNTIQDCIKNEEVTSITTILIGINDLNLANNLQSFQSEVGISQYVSVSDASPQKLAKLANFVSQSISSKSQNLGGTSQQPASQVLTI